MSIRLAPSRALRSWLIDEGPPPSGSEHDRLLGTLIAVARERCRVTFPEFGRFALYHHAPRVGRHPVTGETVETPAKRELVFTPDRSLLVRLARP